MGDIIVSSLAILSRVSIQNTFFFLRVSVFLRFAPSQFIPHNSENKRITLLPERIKGSKQDPSFVRIAERINLRALIAVICYYLARF
jgi:hypothetical protein